jgi:universal stress protein E
MGTLRSILVAVKDPSSRRLAAIGKAVQLAKATGARLDLFHAISTPLLADAYVYSPQRLVQAERAIRAQRLSDLERLAARVRRRGIEVAVSADWDYPAHEAIVRRASRIRADLIVAERHAGRHTAAWLLHITDWELIRLSPIPVLLVKSTQTYQRPTVLASVDPSPAHAKETQLDREILRVGRLVSGALRGKLHAMHAFMPIPPLMMIAPAKPTDANVAVMLASDARAKAKAAFGRLLASGGIPARRRHLVARPAIEAIPQTARRLRCSIVVMGAVSRSGLGRVFIGNTAERVLDELQCDVLVVKPSRFVNRVGRARRGARIVMSAPPVTF